jgi:hypothetical protein
MLVFDDEIEVLFCCKRFVVTLYATLESGINYGENKLPSNDY